MRPGQTAPECRNHRRKIIARVARFNEAGADCPGMPSASTAWTGADSPGFNEAGADCPGMPSFD